MKKINFNIKEVYNYTLIYLGVISIPIFILVLSFYSNITGIDYLTPYIYLISIYYGIILGCIHEIVDAINDIEQFIKK